MEKKNNGQQKKGLFPKVLIALLFIGVIGAIGGGCSSEEAPNSESQSAEKTEIGTVAEYDDCVMEILDATKEDGIIRIKVNFTNNGSEGIYGLSAFAVKAFQNGTELDDLTDINDEADGENLIKEVKDGASLQGEYSFQTVDDSTVEFDICTPTADEEVLAKKEF